MKKLIAALFVGLTLSAAPVVTEVGGGSGGQVEASCSYHHWSSNVERWHTTAMNTGWSECQWYHLSCIIYRESRGYPMAHNGSDPRGGSFGLTQINGVHVGWLSRAGIIRYAYDLYTGWRNLRAARALYGRAGWSPWGSCG
jgi:hypothetical protein